MSKTVLILGAGTPDGVGGALAKRFASEGRHVVVSGRTEEKVRATADAVASDGGSVEAFKADVTSQDELEALFDHVRNLNQPLDCVIFNAGNNHPIPFSKLSPEEFEQYWRVGCMGGFLVAKLALPILADQGEGSLLFTGASASLRGRPMFSHFASSKAGLRNLAQALAREFGPQGVHVAHVVVDGVINGEQVRGRFAEYLDQLGEDGALEPVAIADAFWWLHNQPRSAWTHELDVRPFKENW